MGELLIPPGFHKEFRSIGPHLKFDSASGGSRKPLGNRTLPPYGYDDSVGTVKVARDGIEPPKYRRKSAILPEMSDFLHFRHLRTAYFLIFANSGQKVTFLPQIFAVFWVATLDPNR